MLPAALMATLTILGVIIPEGVEAGKTQRWEIEGPAQFMKGELDRLILTSDGELHLGYGSERLGEFAKEIWCSVTAPDGTIYFGTGTPADVYALGRDRRKPVRVLSTANIAVTSLAMDGQGNLYVGTMANGNLFRISAEELRTAMKSPDGEDASPAREPLKPWITLSSPYLWSLLVGNNGELFVGTGPGGNLYRVGPDGKSELWYTAPDSNILCLALDGDGTVLAGGGDRGVLYRIRGKDDAEAVHEFDEDEVKSIVVRNGEIFIGVNHQKARRARAASGRPAAAAFEKVTQELTSRYGRQAEMEGKRQGEAPMAARVGNLLSGAIYVRRADGRVDKMASWENESLLEIKLDGDGHILSAMANEARVYRVTSRQYWELLFDLREQQATTLAIRDGKLAFVGTGNIGVGYAIDAGVSSEGVFTSEVHDAKFASRWGNVVWRGSGSIDLATRSGNTRSPDDLWSDWLSARGSGTARVASPHGRYIQLRARLSNQQQPVVSSMTVYMHTQNQKPDMGNVTVDEQKPSPPSKGQTATPQPPSKPDGIAIDVEKGTEDKPPAAPAQNPARPKPSSSAHRIAWLANDPDGDTLVFRLFYQRAGDKAWMPISTPAPLTKTEYVWETESVPDGWYRVKVVASDEQTNPAGGELTDEQLSQLFKVDNRRPEVVDLAYKAATGLLTGKARDAVSLIAFLEYAVDGGDWKYFLPDDGIFDAREESYQVTMGSLSPGVHTVAVRAIDEEGNIGVETLGIELTVTP
jgi:hypothetical protein